MHYESCSCGASVFTLRFKRATEWRSAHQHEMPAEPEQPTVVESGSSHERDTYPWMPDESRVRIGFTPNRT